MDDEFTELMKAVNEEVSQDCVSTLRTQLIAIARANPSKIHVVNSCIKGISGPRTTLLHVLAAAHAVNEGIMLRDAQTNTDFEDETGEFERLLEQHEPEEGILRGDEVPSLEADITKDLEAALAGLELPPNPPKVAGLGAQQRQPIIS